MQNIKIPFFTILFIFLGLFVYTKLFGPIPFAVTSVSTTKTDVFSVSGEGEESAIPDTANIHLGITNTNTSIANAQNQTNTVINKITSDLKNLGVEENNMKTTNYSVNPDYNYSDGQQRINGYTVSANIAAKVSPIDKLNQVIDIAVRDGANTIGGIQFIVNDELLEKLKQQARKEAIANAKKKAKDLANESGIILGRIINVSETGGPNPIPVPFYGRAESLPLTSEPTRIEPGQSTITSTITLSYEIR